MNHMCHIWHVNVLGQLLTLHCVGSAMTELCFKSFGFAHSTTLDKSMSWVFILLDSSALC